MKREMDGSTQVSTPEAEEGNLLEFEGPILATCQSTAQKHRLRSKARGSRGWHSFTALRLELPQQLLTTGLSMHLIKYVTVCVCVCVVSWMLGSEPVLRSGQAAESKKPRPIAARAPDKGGPADTWESGKPHPVGTTTAANENKLTHDDRIQDLARQTTKQKQQTTICCNAVCNIPKQFILIQRTSSTSTCRWLSNRQEGSN